MVNLELYKIFKIVADEENLTKASKILHISQPAVTKHIKNLENELNVRLFERSKYGMILNENGKKLYSQIKDPIDILLKSENIVNQNKEINLGVHINMPDNIYNRGIASFYEKNSKNVINIHRLNATTIFSALEKQEIDLAFSKKYADELYDTNKIRFIRIGELQDVFVVNNHSQYLNKQLTASELRKITIYTLKKFSSAYQNLVKVLGYKSDDKINVINVDFSGIIELLKCRDIIAVVTKEYVQEKLINKELNLLDVDFSLPPNEYGVYYHINNKSKGLDDLVDSFKDTCKI